jgi:hypothetical protein
MGFSEALRSTGPAAGQADKMALYGWLIGDWTMDATVYADDGSVHPAQGAIHFGWVLEGRAIQDVWILPGFFHGTTLRIYDPGLDAWHILWSDPVKQYFSRQIGRARGNDIVQEGQNDAGEPTRWSFTDITADQFCWVGERSRDGGATWHTQAVFLARRVAVEQVKPMLDHVSIGVRDLPASKRFYDAVLQPLGYACLSEGADSLGKGLRILRCGSTSRNGRRRRTKIRACISVLRHPRAAVWMRFMPLPCVPAARTMGSRESGPITEPATTPPSLSILMATVSRRIMTANHE